jgi:hypothetical protein
MRQLVASNDVTTKAENNVGIRCQAMLSEDLVHAIVNCSVCELVIAL